MKAEFSELQFSYGITREIEDGLVWGSIGTPYFPNLIEEASLGYDVRFDSRAYPIFLQYKISDYMSRANAKEWLIMNRPYFRFQIYSGVKSNQHKLLVDLSQKYKHTYYCAPGFINSREYTKLHIRRQIAEKSIFVPVQGIGYIYDDLQHHIIFDESRHYCYFCSEPREIRVYKDIREILYNQSDEHFSIRDIINYIIGYLMEVDMVFRQYIKLNDTEITKNYNFYDRSLMETLFLIGNYLIGEYGIALYIIKSE